MESATLLYIVSVIDAARHPPPWALCVFSRKRLYPVTISALGEESLDVNFTIRNGGEDSRRRGSVTAQVLEVSVNADAGSGVSADSFYFLGLRNRIRIYMDPALRVPVRVVGRVPDIGEIELDLREVQLH